jgi:hypothetical protein
MLPSTMGAFEPPPVDVPLAALVVEAFVLLEQAATQTTTDNMTNDSVPVFN